MATQDSNQSSNAEGRAGTYRLFSRLYARELDREVLEFLRAYPGFFYDPIPVGMEDEKGLQTLRVAYSHLFLMNIYPYESLYTGPEVMLNTAESEQVQAFYEEFGFNNNREIFADHIASELEFMATLAQQEAQFWRDNLKPQAVYLAKVARTFLSKHLLKWLPVFSLAIQRYMSHSFYRVMALETLHFVCGDFEYLGELLNEKTRPAVPPSLPPKTFNNQNLSELIRYLITPSESGFFLYKTEIARLGSSMELPAGGADRFQMLKNLFENAAQYGMLETLLGGLYETTEYYQSEFTRLGEEFGEASLLWQGWQNRLSATQQLLEEAQQSVKSRSDFEL